MLFAAQVFIGVAFMASLARIWFTGLPHIIGKVVMGLSCIPLIGFIVSAALKPEGLLYGPGLGVWLGLVSAVLFMFLKPATPSVTRKGPDRQPML